MGARVRGLVAAGGVSGGAGRHAGAPQLGGRRAGRGRRGADTHPPAGQLAAVGGGVVQGAAGYSFSAALTAGGEVYLWGSNALGQLANGECSPCGSSCSRDSSYCYCDACLGQDVAAPVSYTPLTLPTKA